MNILLSILFWSSLIGVCYAYIGYPSLICAIARRRGKAPTGEPIEVSDSDLPEITILIAAYNASQHIGERIENLLCCDYPAARMNILVASDGSNDGTAEIARGFADDRITTIEFPQRCGKAQTLARAMQFVTTDIVVLTDASTQFDRLALRRLASHFADPRVGIVAGQVSIVDQDGMPSESMYWRSEMMVRKCEARLGIMLGASGAIYAMRRDLFVTPTRPVINDDMVLPMLVHLRHRCRYILESTARAYSSNSDGMRDEFRRRCRTSAGGFQCLAELRDLWTWRNKVSAAAFVSHKLVRWICPFLLFTALASNLALASNPLYGGLLVLQLAAYATALIGLVATGRGIGSRIARIATSFVVMNTALAVGFFRWVVEPNNVIWAPTQRACWSDLVAPAETLVVEQKRAA